MDKKRLRYLEVSCKGLFKVWLLEHPSRTYHWISVFLYKRYRSRGYFNFIQDCVFGKVSGCHYVHILRHIYTAIEYAEENDWEYVGNSNLFYETKVYRRQVKSRRKNNKDINVNRFITPYGRLGELRKESLKIIEEKIHLNDFVS